MSIGKDSPTLVGAPAAATAGLAPHVAPLGLRGGHVHHHLRGLHLGRLRSHRVLIFFMVGLVVLVGAGAAAVALVAPSSAPLCQPYTPCGPAVAMTPLVNQTVWRSSQYGFTLEYPGNIVSASNQTGSGLTMNIQANNITGTVVVDSVPASQASPSAAITAELGKLPGVSQLSVDSTTANQILGPGVGYRSGAGGVYTGYSDASQGVGNAEEVYVEAATDGRVTIVVAVISPSGTTPPKDPVAQVGDGIINTVKWS